MCIRDSAKGVGVAGEEVDQAGKGELDTHCASSRVSAGDPATGAAVGDDAGAAGVSPRFKKEATMEAAADPACLGCDGAVSSARLFPAASATSFARPTSPVRSAAFPAAAPGRRVSTVSIGTADSEPSFGHLVRWVAALSLSLIHI